jgi:hypothetical protein
LLWSPIATPFTVAHSHVHPVHPTFAPTRCWSLPLLPPFVAVHSHVHPLHCCSLPPLPPLVAVVAATESWGTLSVLSLSQKEVEVLARTAPDQNGQLSEGVWLPLPRSVSELGSTWESQAESQRVRGTWLWSGNVHGLRVCVL